MEKAAETMVTLKCGCNCCMLVAEKTVWEDGDIDYNISVQDSRYDHDNTTLRGRIKGAIRILFGKPVYYSDIFIDDPQRFRSFVEQLNDLYEKGEADKDLL